MFYQLLPLIILMFMSTIPIFVGVYVYRDATRRGMEATLWTLISVIVPMLAGFIVYLIIRGRHLNLKCPNCGCNVESNWNVCPKCGMALQNNVAKEENQKV